MSGGFGLNPDCCNAFETTLGTAVSGTAIPPSATANTKGAWTQLISSTPSDATWMMICAKWKPTSAAQTRVAFDIGVGAGGSEKVIVSNVVLWCYATNNGSFDAIALPIQVPAGTRVSARCQATGTSGASSLWLVLQMFDGSFLVEGAAGVDALGFVSSTTLGTAITPGVSGAKGSYAQLIASTARDYVGIFAAMDQQTFSDANYYDDCYDLAIGAGGSEKIIVPDFNAISGVQNGMIKAWWPYLPIPILAGSRIAARMACQGSPAIGMGLTVYGVYQ